MGKDQLSDRFQAWEESYRKAVEKHPERKARFESPNEFVLDPLYTPLSTGGDDYLDKIGFPGEYPFTRGVQTTMHRGRLWTMRQYAGFGTARQTNERFRYLLEQGQTGLSCAFDLPTQMGYCSSDEESLGEVGKVGVAIDTIEDMEILMSGIDQTQVTTSMTINATGPILLALYAAVAKRRGHALSQIGGTIQNDILKEYIARGTYIYPPQASMRIITDTFAYGSRHLPRWNPISISGYHIREAGSTAVQEVAFTLANGIAYVEAAIQSGLCVDEFAPRLSFFFNAHNEFLEEVAKFRAVRRLWAQIMKERFGAKNPRSQMLRFHAQTGGSTLTAQQPENNIVRVATQALSAILGGCQSLHCNAMDEALSLPTEKSAQIALRTQQVLAYESGVAETIDPLAGSYFVEHLTDKIEEEAKKLIARVDELGGAVQAIETGFMQRAIQESAYRYQQRVESGDLRIVGVNCLQQEEAEPVPILEVAAWVEKEQVERVHRFKKRRAQRGAQAALDRLAKACEGDENLLPHFIECVEKEATLGEICHTMRRIFGHYQPKVLI